MTTLGIDYSASRAYFGIVEDKEVKHIASLTMGKVGDFLNQYQSLLTVFWSGYGIRRVIIEQAWSREGRYAWTALKTEHMKTLLEAGALLSKANDFEVITVLPNVWRKAVLNHGNPKDAKQEAVNWVKYNLGYDVPVLGKTGRGNKPDHNFAEAICLAVYGEIKSIR